MKLSKLFVFLTLLLCNSLTLANSDSEYHYVYGHTLSGAGNVVMMTLKAGKQTSSLTLKLIVKNLMIYNALNDCTIIVKRPASILYLNSPNAERFVIHTRYGELHGLFPNPHIDSYEKQSYIYWEGKLYNQQEDCVIPQDKVDFIIDTVVIPTKK